MRFSGVVILFVSAFLSLPGLLLAQTENNLDSSKVDLVLECRTTSHFRFRLLNQTRWAISVPTYKNHFGWANSNGTRKPKSALLENGAAVFVLPEDIPIDSILYFLDRTSTNPTKGLEISVVGSDSFNVSWIEKKGSIIFTVEREKLKAVSRIYVKFNYEWELNKSGIFVGGLNEHRAEFALNSSIFRSDECARVSLR